MLNLNGRQFDICTLDFETAFDKDYTLSKMSTSQYVRDERFLPFMCGIKLNGKPGKVWGTKNIKHALQEINWKRTALLAHNTAFDGFICTQHYGVTPALYLDTLSMARAVLGHAVRHDLDTVGKLLGVGGKEGSQILVNTKGKRTLTNEEVMAMAAYCAIDVQRCHDVFWKMYEHFPDDELELVDTTIRMFCEPTFSINSELVQEELEAEVGGKMRTMLNAGANRTDLMSNPKFATLLTQAGVTPPMKISLKTKKLAYAFSKDSLEQVAEQHPHVADLIEARIKVKSTIGETRAQKFLEAGLDGQLMPVGLSYYGAHTGRWSGTNRMNMQNLPRGGRLRRSLTAPKGHQVVVADSAQIEARINAWLWGQADLVEAFRLKKDIYSGFASKLFKRPVDRKRKEIGPDGKAFYPDFDAGFIGKTAILGLGFQMGVDKFYAQVCAKKGINFSYSEAAEAVELYRAENHMIVRGWKQLAQIIPRMARKDFEYALGPVVFGHECVRLPSGLFLRYPELRVAPGQYESSLGEASFAGRNNSRTKLYGGLMCENLVQALARCIIAEQMLVLKREGERLVTTTHDEIVVVAPNRRAERVFERMIEVMSTPPEWAQGLPLFAEGGFSGEYSK
ncbi:MAG: DNA polymerase [Actinomycetota bacterium]|nr:DNA polymerase [Actinomycetota bacterium]